MQSKNNLLPAGPGRLIRSGADFLTNLLENIWWGYPLLLLLVGLASYETIAAQLGFYWDDWEVVYLTRLASVNDMMAYFSVDNRPFVWPYALYSALAGVNPAGWHLISFLLRYGGILFLYLALLAVWPARKFELRWAGLLLMVFPGFMQQSLSATYSRQFSSFFLFSLSLYWMVLAVRGKSNHRLYWILSLLAAIVQVFTIEYYVGLELSRPILLWVLDEQQRSWRKLGRMLARWSPFLLAFVGYVWWRLVYHPSTQVAAKAGTNRFVQSLLQAPFAQGAALLQKIFFDGFYLVFRTWLTDAFNPQYLDFAAKITWFAFGAGLLLSLVVLLMRNPETPPDGSLGQASLFGIGALFFAAVPLWASGRTIADGGLWADRFTQAPMIGASLLIVVLVSALARPHWRPLILGVMLCSAIMTQIVVANKYRLDWEYQRDLYWQLYWRAPALLPDTAIYSAYIPSVSLPDGDASFAISVLYATDKTGTNVPYWLFTAERISQSKLTPNKPMQASLRNIRFVGGSSDGITLSYPNSSGCLRVFDRVYSSDPSLASQAFLFPFSHPARIQAAAKHAPDAALFGAEPPADWCTFFEKGDLARQYQHWDEAIRIYQQAESSGFVARSGGEYLPFIEAYVRRLEFSKALDLSTQAAAITRNLGPLLCSNWARMGQSIQIPPTVLDQVRSSFACSW